MRIINFQNERIMLMEVNTNNNCPTAQANFTSNNEKHRVCTKKDINELEEKVKINGKKSSLSHITQKRDVCERFFETLLTDLKNTITEYSNGYIDSSSFADEVQFLGESMKALCEDGEIRNILDRAQLVMLQKLTADITEKGKTVTT